MQDLGSWHPHPPGPEISEFFSDEAVASIDTARWIQKQNIHITYHIYMFKNVEFRHINTHPPNKCFKTTHQSPNSQQIHVQIKCVPRFSLTEHPDDPVKAHAIRHWLEKPCGFSNQSTLFLQRIAAELFLYKKTFAVAVHPQIFPSTIPEKLSKQSVLKTINFPASKMIHSTFTTKHTNLGCHIPLWSWSPHT